ncbi:4-galactosyl-N-acetylglucosaminide 3-alpha-L-fucosyltransferase 9-like [Trichomycterus rosablanca]|uniref:4-galactosyl-N-acetylglucosaminide 3-alpha-L-fucosyltransferase 9-like n=1 Tax=Trichomycterus rosablanca TaxID=2290929 RepID=UPI002F354844
MPSEIGHDVCRFFRFAIFILPTLLMGSLYYMPSFQHLIKPYKSSSTAHHPILVLIWLWPFDQPFDLELCSSQFNIQGCHLTVDQSLYDKADAVLIHHRDITRDLSNLPQSPRPPHQKWIWMNLESPSNTAQIPSLDNQFNVSLSYRRDADISVPYGRLVPVNQDHKFVPPEKDKLVCWIVSNYNPEHKRVHYYEQLQKYVQVHVYGDYFERHVSEEEYKDIVSGCKFYLSFENSMHKDYITEKLFNALDLGAIPIVVGPSRHNYECFIPADAFIHVNDFSTVRALAKYLLLLDRDEAMYRRYFRWKRHFQVKTFSFPAENACLACDYIRQNRQYQVLMNLYQWYWDKGEEPDKSLFLY